MSILGMFDSASKTAIRTAESGFERATDLEAGKASEKAVVQLEKPLENDTLTKQAPKAENEPNSPESEENSTSAKQQKGWSTTSKVLAGSAALIGTRMALRGLGYQLGHIPFMDQALDKAVLAGIPYAKWAAEQSTKYASSTYDWAARAFTNGAEKTTSTPLVCDAAFGRALQDNPDIFNSTCEDMRSALQTLNVPMTPENVKAFHKGNFSILKQALVKFHPDKNPTISTTEYSRLNDIVTDFKNSVGPKPKFSKLHAEWLDLDAWRQQLDDRLNWLLEENKKPGTRWGIFTDPEHNEELRTKENKYFRDYQDYKKKKSRHKLDEVHTVNGAMKTRHGFSMDALDSEINKVRRGKSN